MLSGKPDDSLRTEHLAGEASTMTDLAEKVNSSRELKEIPIKAAHVRYAGIFMPVTAVAANAGLNAAIGNLAAAVGVGIG
jgi:hypothetical protein